MPLGTKTPSYATDRNVYSHAPHNDVSVNNGDPIMLYYITLHYKTVLYSIWYHHTGTSEWSKIT